MKNIKISKVPSLEDVLLVGSFIGIAFSAYYCVPFVALLAYRVMQSVEDKNVNKDLQAELAKVQAVSAQIEELQNSINNVRAAVSLGSRR
jgi:hypothetical protein